MLLENLKFDLDTFLYLERYVNNGSPSGFTDKYTTSEQTSPFGRNKSFFLYGIEQKPDSDIVMDYGSKPDMFKWDLLVHPDMAPLLNHVRFDERAVLVSPTASSRTVRVLDGSDWYIKLAYKKLIGRIDRTIDSCHAQSSVEVSSLIEQSINTGELPSSFYFLREPFARVINHEGEAWGVVMRDAIPFPRNPRIKFQIPAFALFSVDRQHPEHESLLVQLIRAKKPTKIEDYLLDQFLFPLFDCYFMLLIRCGLQLECHSQNCLFAVDDDLNVVGIVEKDAESIDKDLPLMAMIGKDKCITPSNYKCLRSSDYNYQIMHSFMFDFKLGEYLISPIISEAGNYFSVNRTYIEDRIKAHNKQYIQALPKEFFPVSWYDYENVIHDRNKPRPYVAHESPRYR